VLLLVLEQLGLDQVLLHLEVRLHHCVGQTALHLHVLRLKRSVCFQQCLESLCDFLLEYLKPSEGLLWIGCRLRKQGLLRL
jgi:hypothetical protein